MTKFLALLFIFSLALPAQVLDSGRFIWFNHVKNPVSLTEVQLLDVAARLCKFLTGDGSVASFVSQLPDDSTPRIVFLTIGDDLWPARTYFGTGFSFRDAMTNAIHLLQANEQAQKTAILKQADAIIKEAAKAHQAPPHDWVARKQNPTHWTWLKMHVVQATRPYEHFQFNHTRFAFSDLVGIAFKADLGFAFTPDQIMGRYLLTNQNFISKKQIGNIIAEASNFEALSIWLRASTNPSEQIIYLFEADTYFTDGITSQRLFRGHQLPALPTAGQCLEAAGLAAKAVHERMVPATGELRSPFPDWRQPQPDREDIEDLAEFALALQALAKENGNPALLDTARHAMVTVREAMMNISGTQQLAVVTPEPLPPNSPKQPRTIGALKTNALALLALLNAYRPGEKDLRQASQLAAFIASMKGEDGNFHSAVTLPGRQPLNRKQASWMTQATDNALAIMALQQAGSQFKQPAWQKLAVQTLHKLINDLNARADNQLGNLDPWIAEALTGAKAVSKKQARLLPRIATALIRARTLQPAAPDLAGSLTLYPPDTTAAARNAWTVATLASWFQQVKPDYQEALMAENAVTVAFHLQAAMRKPDTTALSRPKFYLDFFRDRLDGYSFSLAAQTAQIFSLTRNATLLKRHHQGIFPDAKTAAFMLAQTRKFINVHPAYLQEDLLSNNRGISEEARAVMGEITNRKKSHVSPRESGLFDPKPRRGK